MKRWSTRVRVPATHPALPGHFPTRAIVPAAWLLTIVDDACRQAFGEEHAVVEIAYARFRRPLLPDRAVELALACDQGGVRFALRDGDGPPLADGLLQIGSARP